VRRRLRVVVLAACADQDATHVCVRSFNRLELPVYTSKKTLELQLTLVLSLEVTGFGLD
jgi:hypothetical protein